MLTRLQDSINPETGKKIIRYGMWGTSAEIERHGRKFRVVQRGKRKGEFKTLEEAALFLAEIARR